VLRRDLTFSDAAVEKFEMLNLSFYQKLNAERHDILIFFSPWHGNFHKDPG
jgi:hypothetical protein